jgi:asparagine synthase (glutamine-hydrolysing)
MCGICGKLNFNGDTVERNLISVMSHTLLHRGPDDEGIFIAPHVGLGQRRLSIIDLNRESCPPLPNEDGTLRLIFNGEIYNFQNLRENLIDRGHIFRTHTDTEVIIHLYEEYGTECLAHLRGMFAFALWDDNKKLLFAARDRFGKKPFYYTKTTSAFIFGSEIKAITADPEVSISPNYTAIDRYLTYQYVPSPLTAFEEIFKLPPAHFLICRTDGSLTIDRYWSPPLSEKILADQEEIESEILIHLKEAIRLRLISDVPLGVLLSGGIDSSFITAIMAQENSKPIKTFSIGFEDNSYNELPYARLVARLYGTEHHELIVKPNAIEVLPELVRHYNEPFADPSALPSYYVTKMARESVTVALSGDGGDETFSGYENYGMMLRWQRADFIPNQIRKQICNWGEAIIEHLPYHNVTARFSRGLQMLGGNLRDRYGLTMSIFKPQEKRMIYTPDFQVALQESIAANDIFKLFPWDESIDPIDWMMNHDQNHYLPDCLLVKIDVASMANSLEVRCPFLDHRFVEFSSSIPTNLKRNNVGGKLILRNLAKRFVPMEIVQKRKTGFGIPLEKWFRTDLYRFLREILMDDISLKRGLFNPIFLEKMVNDHKEGKRDWSTRLWALLFLELWFREFID